jgi:hypothetical protein
VCLRDDVVGGAERDRPVGAVEQRDVLGVHVEVAHGDGDHDELNRRSIDSRSPTAENTPAMRARLTLPPYFWYF